MENTDIKRTRYLPAEFSPNNDYPGLPAIYRKAPNSRKCKINSHAFVVDWQIPEEKF